VPQKSSCRRNSTIIDMHLAQRLLALVVQTQSTFLLLTRLTGCLAERRLRVHVRKVKLPQPLPLRLRQHLQYALLRQVLHLAAVTRGSYA
jgi:hypothetical protein